MLFWIHLCLSNREKLRTLWNIADVDESSQALGFRHQVPISALLESQQNLSEAAPPHTQTTKPLRQVEFLSMKQRWSPGHVLETVILLMFNYSTLSLFLENNKAWLKEPHCLHTYIIRVFFEIP